MNNQQALIPPPTVYQRLQAVWMRARRLLLALKWALAAVGLAVVLGVLSLWLKPSWFVQAENSVFNWLAARREQIVEVFNPDAQTADQKALESKSQTLVASWLARKYFVADEPLKTLVKAAYEEGRKAKIDPLLILAVAATESRFNPIAQSEAGAQGLMQVMTKIHADKYAKHGGTERAFDPVTNLRVGVMVLKETIARAGSVEGGLKFYVGAANLESDGGYAEKVLGEMQRLEEVAAGKKVSMLATTRISSPLSGVASEPGAQGIALDPTPLSVSTELSVPPRVLQSLTQTPGSAGLPASGAANAGAASSSAPPPPAGSNANATVPPPEGSGSAGTSPSATTPKLP